jgi:hypothetical protein
MHRVLVLVSLACCTLVAVSFSLFALDQLSGASKGQVAQLDTTATLSGPPAPTHPRGQPRRFIDGAAQTLTSPFADVIATDSDWIRHGAPAMFALLVYGVGLGYLARYTRGRG